MLSDRSLLFCGFAASVVGAMGKSVALSAAADPTPFSCHAFSSHGRVYGLQLPEVGGGWPLHVSHIVSTPPTTTEYRLSMDLCSPLAYDPRRPNADQCPDGTLACLSIVNSRERDDDRLIQVIPVASTAAPLPPDHDHASIPLHWSVAPLDDPDPPDPVDGSGAPISSDDSHTLRLSIRGKEYAHVYHHLILDLECDHSAATHAAPRWTSYDPMHGQIRLHWRTPRACPHRRGSEEPERPTPGQDDEASPPSNGDQPSTPDPSPEAPVRKWGFLSTFFLL